MNLGFREEVFKASFRPLTLVEEFEVHLRGKFGLKNKYDSARLSIGRSLAQPTAPEPIASTEERGKPIPGELLFGGDIDLWIAAIVMDGELGPHATLEDFRALLEAHWARGGKILRDELISVRDDETRLMSRLADLLPEGGGPWRWGGPWPFWRDKNSRRQYEQDIPGKPRHLVCLKWARNCATHSFDGEGREWKNNNRNSNHAADT